MALRATHCLGAHAVAPRAQACAYWPAKRVSPLTIEIAITITIEIRAKLSSYTLFTDIRKIIVNWVHNIRIIMEEYR